MNHFFPNTPPFLFLIMLAIATIIVFIFIIVLLCLSDDRIHDINS